MYYKLRLVCQSEPTTRLYSTLISGSVPNLSHNSWLRSLSKRLSLICLFISNQLVFAFLIISSAHEWYKLLFQHKNHSLINSSVERQPTEAVLKPTNFKRHTNRTQSRHSWPMLREPLVYNTGLDPTPHPCARRAHPWTQVCDGGKLVCKSHFWSHFWLAELIKVNCWQPWRPVYYLAIYQGYLWPVRLLIAGSLLTWSSLGAHIRCQWRHPSRVHKNDSAQTTARLDPLEPF